MILEEEACGISTILFSLLYGRREGAETGHAARLSAAAVHSKLLSGAAEGRGGESCYGGETYNQARAGKRGYGNGPRVQGPSCNGLIFRWESRLRISCEVQITASGQAVNYT